MGGCASKKQSNKYLLIIRIRVSNHSHHGGWAVLATGYRERYCNSYIKAEITRE